MQIRGVFRNFAMMKEVFHKTVSITMALLLLLSTISWKVEKHYCMGRLIDVALFTEAESCGMQMLDFSENLELKQAKKSCCDDEIILVNGQDELNIAAYDLDLTQQPFAMVFLKTYFNVIENLKAQPAQNDYYPPPILVKNIQLLDQVFLI